LLCRTSTKLPAKRRRFFFRRREERKEGPRPAGWAVGRKARRTGLAVCQLYNPLSLQLAFQSRIPSFAVKRKPRRSLGRLWREDSNGRGTHQCFIRFVLTNQAGDLPFTCAASSVAVAARCRNRRTQSLHPVRIYDDVVAVALGRDCRRIDRLVISHNLSDRNQGGAVHDDVRLAQIRGADLRAGLLEDGRE